MLSRALNESTESAKRIIGGRLFQHRGPAAENARSPKCVLILRTRRSVGLGPTVSAARGISSRAAEFGFLPRSLNRGIYREIRLFTAEFDVFHSNSYFLTENDLKVALLQVCL